MVKFWRLKFLGYPVLFVGVTAWFIYLTFPLEVVKDYLADRIASVLEDPARPVEVKIAHLKTWRLSGVQAQGISISAKIVDKTVLWKLEDAAARVWISGFIFGNKGFSFDLNTDQGEAFGQLGFSPTGGWERFSLNLDDFDFHKTPLELVIGLPIHGAVSMALNITGGASLAKNGAGAILLSASKLILGPGTVRGLFGAGGGLTVPAISLGRVEVEISIAAGHAQSKKISMSGGDLELMVKLDSQLSDSLMASHVNGEGWFKIADKVLTTNPQFGSLLEMFLGRQAIGAKNAFKFNGTLSSPGAHLDSSVAPVGGN